MSWERNWAVKNDVEVTCCCGNKFITSKLIIAKGHGKYCCRSCGAKNRPHKRGYKTGRVSPGCFKKGQVPKLSKESVQKGIETRRKNGTLKRSDEAKKRISESNTGKKRTQEVLDKLSKASPAWWKGRKRTQENIQKSKAALKGLRTGEKNPNWRGGISAESHILRTSIDYKEWRIAVFRRDNFTCQKYGIKGGQLAAHHINNFLSFPELRFDVNNGITFSRKAHLEFHAIYGNTNNTLEQVLEFLNKKENECAA